MCMYCIIQLDLSIPLYSNPKSQIEKLDLKILKYIKLYKYHLIYDTLETYIRFDLSMAVLQQQLLDLSPLQAADVRKAVLLQLQALQRQPFQVGCLLVED